MEAAFFVQTKYPSLFPSELGVNTFGTSTSTGNTGITTIESVQVSSQYPLLAVKTT